MTSKLLDSPEVITMKGEHHIRKYLTAAGGGLAVLAFLASFLTMISYDRPIGLFDRNLVFFGKHQVDNEICLTGTVTFARCGAHLDASACGMAENGYACVCAEAAENDGGYLH